MLVSRDIVVSVVWGNVVSPHGSATAQNGESLWNFSWFLCVLLILCLPNVSNKYHHDTGSYYLSAQHKVLLVGVAWKNVVSAHGVATALNRESLGNIFFVSLCYYYYYVSLFTKIINMFWVGIPPPQPLFPKFFCLYLLLLLLLLLLCITNVSNKLYHGAGSDQLFAQHKVGLLSVTWDNVVSSHGSDTA